MVTAIKMAAWALAAVALLHAAAAAPSCPASCNLTQCPCYKPQQNHDNGTYYRPPGCVGHALPDPTATPSDPLSATTCRIRDSTYPEPQSKYTPHQVHVQPADTSYTSFFVVWATGHALDLVPELPTLVTYGSDGDAPSAVGDADSYVWIGTDKTAVAAHRVTPVVDNSANAVYTSLDNQYKSPLFHTVKVGPLKSNTKYYYQVGDPAKGADGLSSVFNFTVPPLAGKDSVYPFRYGHIADLGQTLNSSVTLDHLTNEKPKAVLLHGDLSYADDYQFDNRVGYQPRWDVWGRFTQGLFSSVPLATSLGNHEEESEFVFGDDTTRITACNYGSSDCARSWLHRYPTPWRSAGSTSPFWYSYNLGPAHVIHLSEYSPSCNTQSPTSLSCLLPINSPQYNWLVADLAKVDRSKTPWLFVSFHEPYYSSENTYGHAQYFQQNLEELLYNNGVDMVFTGHVHAYERSYPVYKGQIDKCAPVYIVIGDGGNEEGPSDYSSPDPAWSAFREASFGHGILDVTSASTAKWFWQRNQDPSNAVTADTVTITRATYELGCKNRKPAA